MLRALAAGRVRRSGRQRATAESPWEKRRRGLGDDGGTSQARRGLAGSVSAPPRLALFRVCGLLLLPPPPPLLPGFSEGGETSITGPGNKPGATQGLRLRQEPKGRVPAQFPFAWQAPAISASDTLPPLTLRGPSPVTSSGRHRSLVTSYPPHRPYRSADQHSGNSPAGGICSFSAWGGGKGSC